MNISSRFASSRALPCQNLKPIVAPKPYGLNCNLVLGQGRERHLRTRSVPDQSTTASTSSSTPSSSPTTPTPSKTDSAWTLLKDYTRRDVKRLRQPLCDSTEGRAALRTALLQAVRNPRVEAGWDPSAPTAEVLLGILSGDVRLAVRALRDYTDALGLPFYMPEPRVPGQTSLAAIQGPIYLKYNSRTGLCYASPYQGRDRGVLVQLAQAQFGHLPLGIFDEDMKREGVVLVAQPEQAQGKGTDVDAAR